MVPPTVVLFFSITCLLLCVFIRVFVLLSPCLLCRLYLVGVCFLRVWGVNYSCVCGRGDLSLRSARRAGKCRHLDWFPLCCAPFYPCTRPSVPGYFLGVCSRAAVDRWRVSNYLQVSSVHFRGTTAVQQQQHILTSLFLFLLSSLCESRGSGWPLCAAAAASAASSRG